MREKNIKTQVNFAQGLPFYERRRPQKTAKCHLISLSFLSLRVGVTSQNFTRVSFARSLLVFGALCEENDAEVSRRGFSERES